MILKSQPLDRLSSKIIGAAIEVHRQLGPGLLESVYDECLIQELLDNDLQVESQVFLPIYYKGKLLNATLRMDLRVGSEIIVEVKAVDRLNNVHMAQLLTYMKLTKCKLGLLINFNEALLKNGIRRVVNGLRNE